MMARKFAHLPSVSRVEIKATAISPKELRFERSSDVLVNYPFSFFFDSTRGHVVLNGKYRESGSEVFCEVQTWLRGKPSPEMKGFTNGWLADSPEQLGLVSEQVTLINRDVVLPATVHRGSSDWVVLVHGRTARRAETYRAFRIFQDLGLTCMAVSLRNNHESTTTRSRISHFGLVEAGDLAAAISYARENGAKRVFVYAISMGAMALAECLREGSTVDAIILDSPAVDWPATLRHQAKQIGVSKRATQYGMKLIGSRFVSRLLGLSGPVYLERLGFSNWSTRFIVPMLIMHSLGDDYVPIAPLTRLSLEHPETVRLSTFHSAKHVQLYNRDPERYRAEISDFVKKLSS